MVRKGDRIRIKPEWQDKGDDAFVWVAVTDEEKGRVDICPTDCGLRFPPVYTVQTDWLQ